MRAKVGRRYQEDRCLSSGSGKYPPRYESDANDFQDTQ